MKKTLKFILFFIATLMLALLIPTNSKAATTVHDEESLNNEINSADPGATITLENDITVTKPIVIAKELIIDGNGHNIVGSSEWTSTSGNQTMFTAQLSAAKLTLKDIHLKNGPKYGVQSYDGATVVLNNVSITGFNYGGVLANGGNVEVINLHLGNNGTSANNGIEIAKGASATNNPTLTMNGVLTSDTTENVIRVAENDSLTEFTIENTTNTTNKIVLTSEKIVLTDQYNNVVAESAVPDKVTGNADIDTKIIVTLMAKGKEIRFTANQGTMITADLAKSHIVLEENEQVDGFFTDANYTTVFNFNDPLNTDTTIYAKISTIETPVPEPQPEPQPEIKDETPKTGVENYLGVAVLIVLVSSIGIVSIYKKNKKG